MAVYFLDTSALAKRYVSEKGSPWIIGLTAPISGNRIYIARITGAEVVSALARRHQGKSLSSADFAIALADFQHDFAANYRIVEITAPLVAHAMTLAEAYILRGYDAVQLAAAISVYQMRLAQGLTPLALISADTRLNNAAMKEGLTVDNPDNH